VAEVGRGGELVEALQERRAQQLLQRRLDPRQGHAPQRRQFLVRLGHEAG
jgi:hypothetical protein